MAVINGVVGKGFVADERIRSMLRAPGWWVSVFLPGYAPGGGSRPDAVWLRRAIEEIRADLVRHHAAEPELTALLAPLELRAASEEMGKGHHHGVAWFVTEAGLEEFDLPQPVGRGYAVGQQPFLLPLLGAFTQPPEFYVLGLAKRGVKLFRCGDGQCAEIPLPEGMPADLEEMLAFDQPDHLRSNRTPAASIAGSAAGRLRTVRFGTGDEPETADRYLHQYLNLIGARMQTFLAGKNAPFVLAGVGYELAAFHRVCAGLNLETRGDVEGAWKDLTMPELYARACAAVRMRYDSEVKELTARLMETPNRVQGFHETLKAAIDGRVWKLFVAEASPEVWLQRWRDAMEENRIAVETLRKGGEVYLAPAGSLPGGAVIAAMLRY